MITPRETTHDQQQADLFKEQFEHLTSLPAHEQEVALAAIVQAAPERAAELRSLLIHAAGTWAGVAVPERLLREMQAELPKQLGPWEVIGELGRGGMGVVLRAKRADGAFEKEVAIKVLPPLLANAAANSSFVREARNLATLDHPNIARLIDAGVAQGCAYFVMDLVEGVPITQHARNLPLKDRVALFLQLASAVSFAHGRLLVHRDIKPANVLVDTQGQVRLLDFGIAKLLSQDELTQTAHQNVFTPAYASPEQIQSEAITVASDVFSLAVLLYVLCTETHPVIAKQDATTKHTASALHAILNNAVEKKPMRAASLPLDLQAVLLKALDKKPQHRYGSVDALAADLQAFLSMKPVVARPPSWSYATAKFVERHQGMVSAAVLSISTILGLSAWSVYSANVARKQSALAQQRANTVREIANKVVFDYNRALEPINGTLEVRKTIVGDAISYLEAELKEAADDLFLQSEIARGFEAVGNAQGSGVTTSNLGKLSDAGASYEKAFQLRSAVCAKVPQLRVVAEAKKQVPACAAQAATMMVMADNLFAQGKSAEAVEKMGAARSLNGEVLAALTATDDARLFITRLQFNLNHRVASLSLRETGEKYARGLALAQENLPLAEALARADTAEDAQSPGKMNLRDANDFLSNRLLASGNAVAALPAIETALALSRAIYQLEATGHNAVYVMSSQANRAEIKLHLNDPTAVQIDALGALDLARKNFEADPQNALFRGRYANIGRRVGALLNHLGTPTAHAKAAILMVQVANVSSVFTPKDGVFWFQHQQVVLQQAAAAYGLGKFTEAQQLLTMFPEQGFDNPRAALDLADAYVLRAKVAAALKQTPAVRQALQLALKPLQSRADSTPADGMNRALLAHTCKWAAQEPAFANANASYQACATSTIAALNSANTLTPWWRARFNSK